MTTAVWYPTLSKPKAHHYGGTTEGIVALNGELAERSGPFPLLVFSHGYGGSGVGHSFLGEALARRGWIVACPDHNDRYSAFRIRTGRPGDFDRTKFIKHAQEIAASGPDSRVPYLYRLDEMKTVLNGMLESGTFGKLIDQNKIAVGGHSFGGYTALGLCGAISECLDSRIKAVLLYSSGASGYLFREVELASVRIPSMYFFGEREREQKRGEKSMAQLAEKIFQNLSPPKFLLEVKNANHFTFNSSLSDRFFARVFLCGSEEQFELLNRYSIAFLEKFVVGNHHAGSILERQDPLLISFRKVLP